MRLGISTCHLGRAEGPEDYHEASLTIEPEKVGPGGKERVMIARWTKITRGQRLTALEQGAEGQK